MANIDCLEVITFHSRLGLLSLQSYLWLEYTTELPRQGLSIIQTSGATAPDWLFYSRRWLSIPRASFCVSLLLPQPGQLERGDDHLESRGQSPVKRWSPPMSNLAPSQSTRYHTKPPSTSPPSTSCRMSCREYQPMNINKVV